MFPWSSFPCVPPSSLKLLSVHCRIYFQLKLGTAIVNRSITFYIIIFPWNILKKEIFFCVFKNKIFTPLISFALHFYPLRLTIIPKIVSNKITQVVPLRMEKKQFRMKQLS